MTMGCLAEGIHESYKRGTLLPDTVEIISHCFRNYFQVLLEFKIQSLFGWVSPQHCPMFGFEPHLQHFWVSFLRESDAVLFTPGNSLSIAPIFQIESKLLNFSNSFEYLVE